MPVPAVQTPSATVAHMSSTADAAPEFNDADYVYEVLQLSGGVTEHAYDEFLAKEVEKVGITIAPTPTRAAHSSMHESALTDTSHQARTTWSESRASISTGLTSRSSLDDPTASQVTRSNPRRILSFSRYENYATQTRTAGLPFPPVPIPAEPAVSLFSVSTRRSLASIRSGFKNRFRLKRSKSSQDNLMSCISCQGEFRKGQPLHTLPCLHTHCDSCLRDMLSQACLEESKMPPRCCSQAVPSSIIKAVYSREDQQIFMRAVVQFSTPRSLRIFCPNDTCGEFIPKREAIDPKHPFEVTCRKCRTMVCSICKKEAHAFGQSCPTDEESGMNGKPFRRRCYKCRNMVESSYGRSCVVCPCKAEFCYTCGAVWDLEIGCPNNCNSEEELARRRLEEEARIAELEREKRAREEAERQEAAEKLAAEQRTRESEQLHRLRSKQNEERDRFCAFEKKMGWLMWTRHGQSRLDVLDRHGHLDAKMKERHAKTAAHLEDRQVGAELELRATLKQAERSVRIRLRHMEAYCDGLGRAASGTNPARVVTERDLRELGQQYNLKDDLERLHQSKINVMRDKQAKQMESLLEKQENEVQARAAKHVEELEALELSFVAEEEELRALFEQRRSRLNRRWDLAEQLERKDLESKTNLTFAPMAPVEWPVPESRGDGGLAVMPE